MTRKEILQFGKEIADKFFHKKHREEPAPAEDITITVKYLETESDIATYPIPDQRKKVIRHKLYNKIAMELSKAFEHRMDMERSQSGRIIYSYSFKIERI